jgi:ketosteroid isomerase-like protein
MTKAREAIAERYKVFEQAFYRGDADTISRMYTEDAELLIPEAPIVNGREAIAQVWKSIVGSGGNTVRVNTGEVQESGDWAYEVGTFMASAPDGNVLNAGKYIVIWKQQSTGEWKTHRDIFNWDVPPAQASNP